MSGLGQSRRFRDVRLTPGLPSTADISGLCRYFAFGPRADLSVFNAHLAARQRHDRAADRARSPADARCADRRRDRSATHAAASPAGRAGRHPVRHARGHDAHGLDALRLPAGTVRRLRGDECTVVPPRLRRRAADRRGYRLLPPRAAIDRRCDLQPTAHRLNSLRPIDTATPRPQC
jgi:hypothetical protein